MYSFQNDYSEGAHPNILRALETINYHQNNSYGLDEHCDNARDKIQEALENYGVDIHFITGGTLTNLTFLSHALRPYEAVISADTGHINTHETGAIEASGHKVLSIPCTDGKLTADLIRPVLKQHENEHWVEPRLVYISLPTELGTVYTKEELEKLYQSANAIICIFISMVHVLPCTCRRRNTADLKRSAGFMRCLLYWRYKKRSNVW